jgi:hypothetical protein
MLKNDGINAYVMSDFKNGAWLAAALAIKISFSYLSAD